MPGPSEDTKTSGEGMSTSSEGASESGGGMSESSEGISESSGGTSELEQIDTLTPTNFLIHCDPKIECTAGN